jgi:putative phage-type endonuclease
MTYTTHDLIQGSPEWHAHRRNHFNASEAAAMLGISPYLSRSDLIRQKATGIDPEHGSTTQALFQAGHDAEAAARGIAESFLQEDLYPVTASLSIDGLPLSASLDGLTMDGEVAWEHKLANADLFAAVRAGTIPEAYRPQMEQQMMITGARRVLFMVSDGTPDHVAHTWYDGDPALRAKILAGWQQFAADVAAYVPQEVIPAPVVAAPDELPALLVELVGEVRSTNLTTWQQAVTARIQAISTDLQTDDDFALAEKTVKFLDDGEKKLEIVKSQALAQTASIDDLFRTIDSLKAEMRAKRLNLDKLVKARKESIRGEIVQEGVKAFADHIAGLNAQIGKPYMPPVPADFAGSIKGKKTVASLRDGVATELARAKIAANDIAGRITINLATLRERASDHAHLFPDTAQIVLKQPDDLASLITARIADHAAKLEAERAKIAEQERAKLEAEADMKAKAAPAAASETPEPQPTAPAPITSITPTVTAELIRERISGALERMDENDLRKVWDFVSTLKMVA